MISSTPVADVSVIIPNWNGEPHLRDCLDSVRAQGRAPSETIVVDNGSTDGSLQLVEREYAWATVIALPENIGFSAAVNRGIQACRGRFVALLNNDTQLDPDWLDILVEALQTHPDAGFVGGKMLNFYKRNIIDEAGNAFSPGGIPMTRGTGEPDDGRYSMREYIVSVSSGAAMYRHELFDRVGLFDGDFDSCYEDLDIAFRSQLAGFKCFYVPEALCYHKRGASQRVSLAHPIRLQERNLTGFYVKNLPWPVLLFKSLRILGARTLRLWRAVRAGEGVAAFEGWIDGLRLMPYMFTKRRQVQRLRTVRLGYVFSLMRGGTVR